MRLATGIGLGVVLPTALAAARKGSSEKAAPVAASVVMAGIPVGGTLASFTVAALGEGCGWRAPFAIAGAVGFAAMLLAAKALPDGPEPGRSPGEGVPMLRWAPRGPGKALLAALTAATFADLFAYYGVSTWLTQLMREFSLPMPSSLQLTMALNAGSVFGSLAASLIAVRLGARRVAAACGALAAACLAGISFHPAGPVAMAALVVFAGAFAISAQNLLNTVVSNAFSAPLRSGALGIALGIGRLGAVAAPAAGGFVLDTGLGAELVLLCFAAASLTGCVLLLAVKSKVVEASSQAGAQRDRRPAL